MEELNEGLQDRREGLAEFAGKSTPLSAFFEKEKIDPVKSAPATLNEEPARSAAGKDAGRRDRGSEVRAPMIRKSREGLGEINRI